MSKEKAVKDDESEGEKKPRKAASHPFLNLLTAALCSSLLLGWLAGCLWLVLTIVTLFRSLMAGGY